MYISSAKAGRLPFRKRFSFILGMILFAAALVEPVLAWGDSFFLVHMLQQTALLFFVPIFILLGLTDELVQPVYSHPRWGGAVRILTKPVTALILFTAAFCVLYMPVVFNIVMSQPAFSLLYMMLMLVLAFGMWWPVAAPAASNNTLQPFLKITYIVGLGVFLTPLGIYIIFGGEVLYSAYSVSPGVGELNALRAQQIGGVAWKVITVILYCVLIAAFIHEAADIDRGRRE
ncbi:cytochrome c oxidase assembly protein [Salibacterium halotolerans]|nr:cytochrome c oxidase assembly protein [Salibacterium halotolerans]